MKNWFRNLLLERIYLKSIKASNKKVIKYGKKIKTISVILDNRLGIDKDSFKNMAESFNLSKKNVRVLTYYQSQNQIGEKAVNNSFTFKDITNFGIISKKLTNFCSKKSDILINYYDKNDINLKYISSKCLNNISIGFTNVDHEINDLIIDVDAKSIELFKEECFKYLKTIYS